MLRELARLAPERELSPEEVGSAMRELVQPSIPDEVKGQFLKAWAQRGESAEELAACVEALLPQATPIGLRGSWNGKALLDCSGTGGGGLNIINVSTGIMLILAAMGVPVVKHGNRGITKTSGSTDVLEAMGIKIDLAPKLVPRCLDEVGCAFLFAPSYYSSLAHVANIRRALAAEGQRTVFNLIGPLLNPARPVARLVGVFKKESLDLYQRTLDLLHCTKYTVACGEDAATGQPLGEVSAKGTTYLRSTIVMPNGETPMEFDSAPPPGVEENLESLMVRNADESAARIEMVISGEDQGLAREMLLINAAVAAWTEGMAPSLEEGMAQAVEAVDSGKAVVILRKWQDFCNDV